MLTSPIEIKGKSFTINTNAVANTSQVTPVNMGDLAIAGDAPPTMRVINLGSADVWIVVSTNPAQVAAFPVPGTVTIGTPAVGWRLRPGAIETFRIPQYAAAGVASLTPNITGPGFYIATISTGVSQSVEFNLGEGA